MGIRKLMSQAAPGLLRRKRNVLSVRSLSLIGGHPLDMYDNVIFWKKYQRMNFTDRILELSRSGEIVIYGDETKDAFEEDWESKLRSHPDIPLFLELNRHITKPSRFDDTKGVPDTSMKKCIETIRDLYFNFEHLKQQLEVIAFS
ncbi:hypothetical protein HS088_TW19G00898 [Tripterygium wilfordii]|uniref:Uncharacterized protein n=1 Tax=Tripterygium wilfordii TaxID=458696 RepID=A0A7J7CAU5_TRIWF|nr:hypothetical protein HS088_TW19G00898 [Tripterygium wilfordii]